MHCGVCNTTNAESASICRSCGSPIGVGSNTCPSNALLPGTKLCAGKFSVGKVLGRGGFGITYLGGDTSLGRSVAIKEFFLAECVRNGATVHPTGAITVSEFTLGRQKFLDEARVLAQFHHRGIVQVYTTFEENNTAYMAMEFIKGNTLASLLDKRGPLPEREVVEYIVQAADALATVHAAKLLHRDIKPDNLMVTDNDRIVLVDFGTAREFSSDKTKRMTAVLTQGYAPLEQYGQHAKFGVYTDIYALAATCYHLLTGQVPIQATDRAVGVELKSPRRLNREVSQTVSDAIMWAMEMRADRRPQCAHDFIKALTGKSTPAAGGGQAETIADSPGGNPYAARLAQLADELRKPVTPFPDSPHNARIAAINKALAICSSYLLPIHPSCPGCGSTTFEAVDGRFTGNCPVCRAGKLMKRTFDLTKCPVCRNGTLATQHLGQASVFCPICRRAPLKTDKRKRLGIAKDLWWVCRACKAEFDVDDLLGSNAKLVRFEEDRFGIGRKYQGQSLPVSYWCSISPQSRTYHSCATCSAAFYEFLDGAMLLVNWSKDPYGVAAKARGDALTRKHWAQLALGLSDKVGNVCCHACQGEFDYDSNAATLRLLDLDAQRFSWAEKYKGEAVALSTWYLASSGKRSIHSGWLCRHCSTEFDTEENTLGSEESRLRLIHSSAKSLSNRVGAVHLFSDWYRVASSVPTAAEENALKGELSVLQCARQQEETRFLQSEQERNRRLEKEFVSLVKKALLAGFIPMPEGPERLPLGDGETLRWSSPAGRLKQRSRRGDSYWDVDGEGQLFVTNQRIVFAMSGASRWQRPLGKLHTAFVECLPCDNDSGRNVDILVLGFDGLQKPIAFWVGHVTIEATFDGYTCADNGTFTIADVAKIIKSHLN